VVVLELATGVAGPYCGKLLADLGASVTKCEPPEGDPIRQEPPLVGGESAFFNYLNANKRLESVALTDAQIDEFARNADIVIHSALGREADGLEARIRAANPAAIVLSLSPYGRSGERSSWQTSPLTEWATGGFHYFGGDPNREPIALPGYQAAFHAGVHAAVAALAGLWHARETGAGQRIEVSHQEAILSDHAWLTAIWTHQGKVQKRTGSLFAKCADGYIYLFNLMPYPNLFILMERFDLLEDEALQSPISWVERFPEVLAALSEWAATRTKQEIYHAAQELRVAISPVNTMADIAASAQLAARNWFEQVGAGGHRFQSPGQPYKFSGLRTEDSVDAAWADSNLPSTSAVGEGPGDDAALSAARRERTQDSASTTENLVAAAPQDIASADSNLPSPSAVGEGSGVRERPQDSGLRTQHSVGPLRGLRLIEVTAHWAGPACGRQFADLGADVIKIELASKPATRALIYTGDDLWPDHYHRSGYFNKLNRNKRAICLDLSKPHGREVFLKLVAKADAVVENNAARVMGQLGLSYEALSAVNPGIIMCSMSGYGATGPERDYSAFGSNIETISGAASLLGYGTGESYGTGSFYADPVTGNHAAVAVLAALHERRRTGRGQRIDVSLLEAVSPFFSQQFLEYTVTGEVPQALGNASPRFSPQNVYPTAGNDCWLALTVRNEADWHALCCAIARADLADDPTFATTEGRRAHAEKIDEAIRDWSATIDHNTAAKRLQAVGVPAAPVMANWEIFTDNHLNDRNFFVRTRHPVAGTHSQPGFPYRFEATPARIERSAPMFAEHNRAVFEDLLGLSPKEIEALYAEGITADAPIYAGGPKL
jgi:crotonobetainyl-CoA:carnitine CoA-transferase CaiB-like acyl-CoA transferase